MTTLVRLAISLFLAILATSCVFDANFGPGQRGNGEVVEDLREVDGEFNAVESSEGIAVYVRQAPEYQIRVEADENIIELIGTRVRNGELQVYAIENIGKATKNVYVSLPEINSLEVNSGGNLNTEEVINSDRINIGASSGGSMYASINSEEAEVDASSGANISLKGQTRKLTVDASSGANIRASDLESVICNADASSGSNIQIAVSEELTADANSGANIIYKGDPSVTKNKSFSGNVSKY